MKKMLFAIAFIFLFADLVSAQPARFGFTAGVTFANMREKTAVTDVHGNYGVGATFGILLDQPMQKNGSFQVGFNFTQKGTRKMPSFLGTDGSFKNVLNYLELPMNVVFKFNKGSGKFMAGAGISGALGIWCKSTNRTNITVVKYLNFGNTSQDDLKGIDFGLNGLVGYEFKGGSSITLNYNQSLNTLYIGGGNIDKLKNRYFGIRYGHLLKPWISKKKK
jgi:hypothetical protein